ncbi:MAG TPA: hypothetical protein VM123_03550 [archaeon]|nr:hypothetical protein [archaeon]
MAKEAKPFLFKQKETKVNPGTLVFYSASPSSPGAVKLRKGLPGRCTSSMAMMEITCLLHAPETGPSDFRAFYGLVSTETIYHPSQLHSNFFWQL